MKCELLHDEYGDARHLPEAEQTGHPDPGNVLLKKGTIVEGEDAWILVRNGAAVPADDECKAKSSDGDGRRYKPMSEAQFKLAQLRYMKLRAGQVTGKKRFDAPNGAFDPPKEKRK